MVRFPPVIRTAVPVDGRFEHIVLSCNALSDHGIIWIEREAQRVLDLILEKDETLEIPTEQRMEQQESLVREHKEEYRAALKRAVTLEVPHAYSPSQYGTFDDQEDVQDLYRSDGGSSVGSSKQGKKNDNWDDFVKRLFDRDE